MAQSSYEVVRRAIQFQNPDRLPVVLPSLGISDVAGVSWNQIGVGDKRLRQTLDGFAEPNTVANVCKLVYGEIGGYNSLLVLEKTGAYVEYLYQRGLLEISNLSELEDNPVIKYRCSNPVPDSELLPKERAYVFV